MQRCKLCDHRVYTEYKTLMPKKDPKEEDRYVQWEHCGCGYVFHDQEFKHKFDADYVKKYQDLKLINERFDYYIRLFAQIIEEKTYGKRMLDVGFCTTHIIDGFSKRGWITTGIDLIPNDHLTGDFETFDFGVAKFDLIWMGDVLQCFEQPIHAIYRAYELLNPDGILFVSTPNSDLLRKEGIKTFGHWDYKVNRSFINESILRRALAVCDRDFTGTFTPIYFDAANTSQRFVTWNNMHCIARKDKIEDLMPFEMSLEESKSTQNIAC